LYGARDTELKEAAALSVLAHLEHLINRELVSAEGQPGLSSAFYLRPA